MPKTMRALTMGLALAVLTVAPARSDEPRDPAGTGGYFFCAMGQTVKYFGLFTGNVGMALAGAIGGGIACGMGW